MFFRLQAGASIVNKLGLKIVNSNALQPNLMCKRWSGHNAMSVEPTNYGWKHFKDMVHLYSLISIVPVLVMATIINVRANPELTEIPEGYEPRHWEYYKHPIARFLAKYMFIPVETEHEMCLSLLDQQSMEDILTKINKKVSSCMRFYNDHRSSYFWPVFGEYIRIGRDDVNYGVNFLSTTESHYLEYAYDPDINPVPTEGYPPVDN